MCNLLLAGGDVFLPSIEHTLDFESTKKHVHLYLNSIFLATTLLPNVKHGIYSICIHTPYQVCNIV